MTSSKNAVTVFTMEVTNRGELENEKGLVTLICREYNQATSQIFPASQRRESDAAAEKIKHSLGLDKRGQLGGRVDRAQIRLTLSSDSFFR